MIFRVGKTELILRKQRSAYETYAREDVFHIKQGGTAGIFSCPGINALGQDFLFLSRKSNVKGNEKT